MYTRRGILASGLALSCAGCQSVDPDDPSPAGEFCEYEARAEPFDPAEDLPPDYTRFQQAFAHRTVREGRATAYYGPEPLKRVSYVELDGAYYRVELVTSYAVDLPALVLSVGWRSGTVPPENSTAVPFGDLPDTDRLALRSAVYGGLYREQVHPETVLDHSESPVAYPSGTDGSELARRDRVWVRWNGRAYEIVVHRAGEMQKPVYVYEAARVATDAASFRGSIADRYVIRLDDLTPGERDILDAAIGGGYSERTRSPSRAWHRMLARLRETEFPESHYNWYIEYEGDRYRLILRSNEGCAARRS